jgi:DNA processing protein
MVPLQIEMQTALPDNDDERVLLKLISHEPCHIDELIRDSGLATTTVSSTLTMMESKGHFWFKRRLQRNAFNAAIAT